MLSGSPIILENFYRTEVLFGDSGAEENQIRNNSYNDKHHHRQYHDKRLQGLHPNSADSHFLEDETSDSTNTEQKPDRQRKNSSKASAYKTTAMSAFNSSTTKDADYPIINVEAENEHFEIIDNVISWMETCRISDTANATGFDTSTDNDVCGEDVDDDNRTNRSKCAASSLATHLDSLQEILPSSSSHHQLSAPGVAWNLVKIFCEKRGGETPMSSPEAHRSKSPEYFSSDLSTLSKADALDHHGHLESETESVATSEKSTNQSDTKVRMRGNDEWAPPRAQIIFNIHEETNFRKLMQRQNYRCAGCGTKIDLELARRLVLYCHYLGKYFCKCCFSHKAINLPCYILQKWDFHKYPVSHFALQLVDKIANEPLFNIEDINPLLYRKVKKLRLLVDIRMQLYYLKIYISTCTQTDQLHQEYTSFTHQHLLQDDVHLYSLNNLIEIQHGKLYEYLNDLVTRSIAHIAQCDRCRAKGHYCQLCGPSSLVSSTNSGGEMKVQTHELIFPFEIGRVAQCRACGCCFHLQCFIDGGQNCPRCERIQRRKAESVEVVAGATTSQSAATSPK